MITDFRKNRKFQDTVNVHNSIFKIILQLHHIHLQILSIIQLFLLLI
jgi:hypothetical protein